MYQSIYEIKNMIRVLDRRLKRLIELHEEGCHERCCPDNQPEPSPPVSQAYGFAYSSSVSNESGVVKFHVAGPLQDVELFSEGLSILKSGIYQIHYCVSIKAESSAIDTASFQIQVNNDITLVSSKTESATTQQLSSNQLVSLMEGDVVKLVANIPQGMSYTLSTLQVVQVG